MTDNGKGFPKENRHRLLEPYMTTREGGTGLGLAIVSKIFEEHAGGIELGDNPMGAAAVSGCGFRGLRRADKQKQAKLPNYAGRMHEHWMFLLSMTRPTSAI